MLVLTCRLPREVKKKAEVQSLHTHIWGLTPPNLYFPSILLSQLQELAHPWRLEVNVAYKGTCLPNFLSHSHLPPSRLIPSCLQSSWFYFFSSEVSTGSQQCCWLNVKSSFTLVKHGRTSRLIERKLKMALSQLLPRNENCGGPEFATPKYKGGP